MNENRLLTIPRLINIFEYEDFPSLVKLYFKETLDKFGLKMNLALNSNEKPVNNFVFLENEYCIVCLDNITSFPYPDITLSFYVRSDDKLIELDQNKYRKNVNLSTEIIVNFYNSQYSKILESIDFSCAPYESYKYSLILNNDLLIQFYSFLLNGNIPKEELIKMVVNKC